MLKPDAVTSLASRELKASLFYRDMRAAFPPLSSSESQEEFLGLPGLAARPCCLSCTWCCCGIEEVCVLLRARIRRLPERDDDLREACDGGGMLQNSNKERQVISHEGLVYKVIRFRIHEVPDQVTFQALLNNSDFFIFYFLTGSVAFRTAVGSYLSLTWIHLSPETVSWALLINTTQFQSVSF